MLPVDLEEIIIGYRLNLYFKERYDVVMTELIFTSKIRYYREFFWLLYYKYWTTFLFVLYSLTVIYCVVYVILNTPKETTYYKSRRKYFVDLDGEIYFYYF